jgi:gliding motility-associated protein GldM
MALPKEPRQKMINLMYLVLTALLALNVSSEILNAFKVVDASLKTSNKNINTADSTLMASFKNKLSDPNSKKDAAIWYPKAESATKLTESIMKYIDSLKVELKKEAGGVLVNPKTGEFEKDPETGEEKYKIDDLDAATRLFGNEEGGKNRGPELEKRLIDYRNAMLSLDEAFAKEHVKTFPVDEPVKDEKGKLVYKIKTKEGDKDFTFGYFHMTPTVAALTLLSKFQNNIKNAENQMLSYFHAKVGEVQVKFDAYSAMVGQSSNYLMPGEELEITAGLGAYSTSNKPTVMIAGAAQTLDADGKASYKIKANGSGSRTVPVIVKYKNIQGVEETKTIDVKYTVGTPGGAAVMPDKMNVFYIGVDNPVTIGSPTGWDKTNVTMSNGTISGQGSVRTVRVSAVGNASINVIADGKSTTFPFRVKRIPDPVFKVGSGKIRMTSAEFKAQQYCRAELENFDFDLRYNVVGSTVFFSGANFPNVVTTSITSNNLGSLQQYISRCGPGSVVTFDQVRVQGPDGVRTIEGKSIALF